GPPRGRPRNPFTLIDKMVSIKNCGDSPVYDITIDPSHCFDANGFAVHNCFTEAWITKEAAAFPYGRLNEQQAYLKDPIQRYKIVEGKMFRDDEGELWIWKIPEKDRLYDIGADVAGGDSSTSGLDNQKQGDFSVAEVVERGSLEQCAEWRGHVLPREFGDILAAIGRFYNDAQIASEVNSFGISTLERLQKVYRNLYLWRKRDTVGVKFTGKFGWQTNYESKNLMVNLLREKLYYQQVVIHSRVLWNELRNFCRDFTPTGQITYCAATGYDDCCFLPGTKITTNPGLKAIEDIQERSHVLTHEGRYRPVSTLMQRQYCGRIRQLKVVGLYDSVSLTDNHPVLVRRNENAQWINARDLKVGDPVLCPKRKNLRPSIFNEDQLWVMGWYLAEGWLTSPPHKGNYRVEFEMHINEEQIARRIADVLVKYDPPDPTFQFVKGKSRSRRLNKVYRSPPRIHKRSDRPNSITLAYSSRYWAQIFEEHCGSGARTKELSDELFLSSGLIPLARGYIEGDGHQAFDGRVHCLSVCSSSEKLIWQIRQILIDHGVWCKIYQPRKVAGQFLSYGKLTNANPSWSLHISKEYFGLFGESTKIHPVISQHHLFRTKETDDGFWPKIRTINDSDYDGLVHNMEVAEDHSYIAGGIAVHNCIAYMIALQTSEDENLDGLYGSVRQKPEEDAKGPVIDAAFTDQKFKDDFNFTPDETLKVDTGNWR
ncbi:MAG TPA: hypothetical protein VK206_05025, partial [Anaerolineales bacterium]|nr:hypothetical protein [Anaerolineales bacterium]